MPGVRQKLFGGIDSIPKWSVGLSHDNKIEYISLHDYKNTSLVLPDV